MSLHEKAEEMHFQWEAGRRQMQNALKHISAKSFKYMRHYVGCEREKELFLSFAHMPQEK